MNTKNKDFGKVAGVITIISAIGIMIVKMMTDNEPDSYIMPVVLLCLGVVFIGINSEKTSVYNKMSPKTRNISITALIICLIVGIVFAFFNI